jgi:hypothetical protein
MRIKSSKVQNRQLPKSFRFFGNDGSKAWRSSLRCAASVGTTRLKTSLQASVQAIPRGKFVVESLAKAVWYLCLCRHRRCVHQIDAAGQGAIDAESFTTSRSQRGLVTGAFIFLAREMDTDGAVFACCGGGCRAASLRNRATGRRCMAT